jgi:hypothetical protein
MSVTTTTQMDRDILPYRCTTHRITKYLPQYADVVARLIAAGFTQADVSWVLAVNECTIKEWRKDHAEFAAAYNSGKEHTKRTLVATGLMAACGYNLTTVKTKVTVEGGIEDPEHPGIVMGGKSKTETTTDTTHYPPNPTLLMYLLSNMDRQMGKTDWMQKLPATDEKSKTLILNVNGSLESAKINELIRGLNPINKELPDGTELGEEEGFDTPAETKDSSSGRFGPPCSEKYGLSMVEGHKDTAGVDEQSDEVF